MRSTLPSGVHVHDEIDTNKSRTSGVPSQLTITPSGANVVDDSPTSITFIPRDVQENNLPLKVTKLEAELIFSNLRFGGGVVSVRCGGCDKEQKREAVIAWSCATTFAIGECSTVKVAVPLRYSRHHRPTPDQHWTLTSDLCTACRATPLIDSRKKCQRCSKPTQAVFCAECSRDRDGPPQMIQAGTTCTTCSHLWSQCTCCPYLYEPVCIYF